VRPGQLPCGATWEDTRIEMPFLEAGTRLTDVITGREVVLDGVSLSLATLLDMAPVAVLSN
jgi:hypothetical protein